MSWLSDRTLYAAWAAGALASGLMLMASRRDGPGPEHQSLTIPSQISLRAEGSASWALGDDGDGLRQHTKSTLVATGDSDARSFGTGASIVRLPSVLAAPANQQAARSASRLADDSSGGDRAASSSRPTFNAPGGAADSEDWPPPPAPEWRPDALTGATLEARADAVGEDQQHAVSTTVEPPALAPVPAKASITNTPAPESTPWSPPAPADLTEPEPIAASAVENPEPAPGRFGQDEPPAAGVSESAAPWVDLGRAIDPPGPVYEVHPPTNVWQGHLPDPSAASISDAGFRPWWQQVATEPFDPAADSRAVDPHGMLLSAMQNSPRIESVLALPAETQAAIAEAEAAFDLTNFLEASFLDLNDPVGNDLTTGGPPRLRETTTRWRAGMRKRVQTGGALEISQGTSLQNSNSLFFNPQDQGQMRLAVTFTQPLLRGAGRDYNQRQIILASIRNEAAWQEYAGQLQTQLAAVSRAYWDLYLRRCLLAQQQRHYQRASETLDLMLRRQSFDAAGSQLARARSAVASRQVAVTRALRDVRNAETELRRLVQDPQLMQAGAAELVTTIAPSRDPAATDVAASICVAVQNRPEVLLKLRELRAACVEHNISRKDLLPSLNFVVSSYVTGLRGQYDVGDAWLAQFSQGGPTYGAGLVYEAPWGQRAAHARVQRAQARLARLNAELRSVLADVAAQVEVSVQNVAAAHLSMKGRLAAMQAAQQDIDALRRQWEVAPGDGRLATAMLDELLDAQQRLLDEENAFAIAENEYITAQVALLRAEGRLMTMVPQ